MSASERAVPVDTLEWVQVESSHLEALTWYRGDLVVMFKNDSVYLYLGVPYDVYVALLNAPSCGEYLNSKIKPVYPCVKVDVG